MGNTGNNGERRQNRDNRDQQQQQRQNYPSPSYPQTSDRPQQTEIQGGRYVFAAAMPYPNPYSHVQMQNPNMQTQNFHYNGYYPPSVPFPLPYDGHRHQQRPHDPSVVGSWAEYPGRHHRSYACHVTHASTPYVPVEHQKAVTIRNDVNVKKETLCMVPDEDNPEQFLVSFTFDTAVAGRISIFFFAKEGNGCSLTSLKEDHFHPVTIPFEEGLGQKFRQPSGTGIDFSLFEEVELTKGDMDVFPLAVKAEASQTDEDGKETILNSQITQAVFEKKENGNYHVKVIKQILWVNSTRYELQEIYGIGNSVGNDFDGSEQGKECVICLSEPRDITVLPCRHMCVCSECAKLLQYQTNRCPICRQPVERLLEINVKNDDSEA